MTIDPLLRAFATHMGFSLDGTRDQILQVLLRNFAQIPYENLTKIIHSSERSALAVKQTPEDVITGFIKYRTGGTCFPLTLTLTHLIRALGYDAHPILADRRYGPDTHCALICQFDEGSWHLIDPGYLLTSPCLIPTTCHARYMLPLTTIELRPRDNTSQIDLLTSAPGQDAFKYRLTYKLPAVDDEALQRAWDRSFGWEMMTYPVVSRIVGDTHLYLQKNTLLIRSATESTRVTLSNDALVHEVATRLSVAPEIVRRALGYLRK